MPSYQTWSATPWRTYVDEMDYAVTVRDFEDLTEQRELRSRKIRRELVYDFGRVDSQTAHEITSWYIGCGGTASAFLAKNYLNGLYYAVRFAAEPFELLRATMGRFEVPPLTMIVLGDDIAQPDAGFGFGGVDSGGPDVGFGQEEFGG